MSPRSNIQARKTKTTVLIVGEGAKDKAFLRHLQDMYVSRNDDIAVKVECGSGGSPQSVVERAIRFRDNRDYDKCIVVLDGDRTFEPDRRLTKHMKKKPIVRIKWINPCMEGLLLEILNHQNFSRANTSVDSCKHKFALYISIDKQVEKFSYVRIFPRVLLDSRSRDIQDLDVILRAFQV